MGRYPDHSKRNERLQRKKEKEGGERETGESFDPGNGEDGNLRTEGCLDTAVGNVQDMRSRTVPELEPGVSSLEAEHVSETYTRYLEGETGGCVEELLEDFGLHYEHASFVEAASSGISHSHDLNPGNVPTEFETDEYVDEVARYLSEAEHVERLAAVAGSSALLEMEEAEYTEEFRLGFFGEKENGFHQTTSLAEEAYDTLVRGVLDSCA
ncbi:MAG: hypothetical protein ABEI58_01800 [Candidatus Nanohaloarchaea archaeon]